MAGASAERIRSVAEWYHRHWPQVDLTITALEKWYSHFLRMAEKKELVRAKASMFCEYCGSRDGTHLDDCVRPKCIEESADCGVQ